MKSITNTATISIDLNVLLHSFPLHDNEHYCLYVHRHDGYDFGYVGASNSVEEMTRHVVRYINDPTVFGVWVSLESFDGTIDVDIIKIMEGSV